MTLETDFLTAYWNSPPPDTGGFSRFKTLQDDRSVWLAGQTAGDTDHETDAVVYRNVYRFGAFRDCRYLLLLQLDPPVGPEAEPEAEREMLDWYSQDHLKRLSEVPRVGWALLYRRCSPHPQVPGFLALYQLEEPGIPDSPAWQTARGTAWSLDIVPRLRIKHRAVYAKDP